VDRQFVADHHGSGKGDVVSVPSDYRRRPPSFMLTQQPNPNFINNIFWAADTFQFSMTISGAAGVTELNQAWNLGQLGNAAAITALFDQFCIYSVFVKIMMTGNQIITPAVSYGQLYTAIDYDNASNISTVAAISQYSSMEMSEIIPGKSHERYMKPCVGAIVGSSGGSGVTTSPQRMWVNSSASSQPHYGFRIINVGNATAQTYGLDCVAHFIIGGRNTI